MPSMAALMLHFLGLHLKAKAAHPVSSLYHYPQNMRTFTSVSSLTNPTMPLVSFPFLIISTANAHVCGHKRLRLTFTIFKDSTV